MIRRMKIAAMLIVVIAMFACSACTTIQPTISGKVITTMAGYTQPVPGVIVSIHDTLLSAGGDFYPHALNAGESLRENPEAIACTVSAADGTFSLKGDLGLPLISLGHERYRVRFHRTDFKEVAFDFDYKYGPPTFIIVREKHVADIPLSAAPTPGSEQLELISR